MFGNRLLWSGTKLKVKQEKQMFDREVFRFLSRSWLECCYFDLFQFPCVLCQENVLVSFSHSFFELLHSLQTFDIFNIVLVSCFLTMSKIDL